LLMFGCATLMAGTGQQLKARAMEAALAAKDAKDKKSQQVAAEAAAAYRQHLMEDLDAFRGVHLNPNAHWDEVRAWRAWDCRSSHHRADGR
jgi:hypothetical protein